MAVWNETTTKEILSTRRIDAEFSQPHYVEAEKRIRTCKVNNLGKLGSFVPGPFGSAFRVCNYDFQSPYRYIRGQDVKPFFILDEDRRFIPEADFVRLKHYAVKKDDVLISVVGTLGNVAVCTAQETPAMFSCKSTIFRPSEIDPYFLLAYLNSASGQLCLLRRQRGAIQMGLNIEDLRSIPVTRLSASDERAIAEKVRRAHGLLISAREKYHSSQQLLGSELGLDKRSGSTPLGHTALFSEIEISRRADADFFQPHYLKLRELIRVYRGGFCRLVNYVVPMRPNFDPTMHAGKAFSYIELADINAALGIVENVDTYCARDLPSRARRIVEKGDVIASSVVGSLDKSALIEGRHSGSLASTGFFHFRPTTLSPEYLLVLLRSQCVTMQLQQASTGGILSSVPDSRLRHIIVPILPDALQGEIGELVAQAHSAKRESERLLAEAKTSIEQSIEEVIKS
jgi:hypothetical protein